LARLRIKKARHLNAKPEKLNGCVARVFSVQRQKVTLYGSKDAPWFAVVGRESNGPPAAELSIICPDLDASLSHCELRNLHTDYCGWEYSIVALPDLGKLVLHTCRRQLQVDGKVVA
jgi:hypothetical protein